MGKEFGIGSKLQDGEKILRVVGEHEDGSLLVSSMDRNQLGPLRRAVAAAHKTLGRRALVETAQAISTYPNLLVGVEEKTNKDLNEEERRLLKIGLFNLGTNLNYPGDLPESAFVGPRVTAENGVMYRIKCPFEGVSRTWQRIARTTRRG